MLTEMRRVKGREKSQSTEMRGHGDPGERNPRQETEGTKYYHTPVIGKDAVC